MATGITIYSPILSRYHSCTYIFISDCIYIDKLEPAIIAPTNSLIVCNYQSQTLNLNNGLPRNIEPILCDRIEETGTIPSLAALIRERSSHNPFRWSWQPE